MPGFIPRVRAGFNVMLGRDSPHVRSIDRMPTYSARNSQFVRDTTTAVLAPIISRISMDVAAVPIRHVMVDERENYLSDVNSELNDRLRYNANIDQTGPAAIQDLVITMLQEGVGVVVPITTSANPKFTTQYDIYEWRVGRVVEFFNRSVRVDIYNETNGTRDELTIAKTAVAVVQNPMYMIMNSPNSTLKRLIDKLALLDVADKDVASPPIDVILQLPTAIKTAKKEEEAIRRVASLERQLYGSKYGIGYVDSTEKITQLNRPISNVLGDRVEQLTEYLYNQLGLTPSIFDGTASPEELITYHNRTIDPILKAITGTMSISFLTKNARSRGHSIRAYPDLFKMAPLDVIADSADKFTRNEIMTSNEVRAQLRLPKVTDADADKLRNKNLNKATDETQEEPVVEKTDEAATDGKGGTDASTS